MVTVDGQQERARPTDIPGDGCLDLHAVVRLPSRAELYADTRSTCQPNRAGDVAGSVHPPS